MAEAIPAWEDVVGLFREAAVRYDGDPVARALLLRMTGEGKEGVAFGLYTMTGRAVAPLAPWLFFVFVDFFGSDRAGLGGICLVLALGLVGMILVQVPGVRDR